MDYGAVLPPISDGIFVRGNAMLLSALRQELPSSQTSYFRYLRGSVELPIVKALMAMLCNRRNVNATEPPAHFHGFELLRPQTSYFRYLSKKWRRSVDGEW